MIACQPRVTDLEGTKPAKTEPFSQITPRPSEELNSIAALDSSQQPQNPYFTIPDTVEYDVQQRLKLVNHGPGSPSKQNLWVALISDDFPYQEVLEAEIRPDNYQIISDEYGNQIVEFDFSNMPADSEILVQIDYRIRINQLQFDISLCEGELPDFYTEAELHIESQNPQIISLSEELVQGHQTICEKVRAFYDFVGNELVYSYNGGNWGAQAALGEMGADCTEFASLMIALNRAAGIPARYIVGLYFTPDGDENLARQEHAWLEVYLPGIGWAPMDPTLGRSSITREGYFAKLPANHIIVNRGRNPSALRGGSYWTYLYWPGNSTEISIEEGEWTITPLGE
jgi:transglutaminase-like putative cysteine protease